MCSDHSQDLDHGPSPSGPLEAQVSVSFLKKYLPPGAMVLDVGCGDGVISASLQEAGFQVIALDPDEAVVSRARERGVDARLAHWPEFDCAPVDAIVFLRSLHHIERLEDAIDRALALLKPDGQLLIDDFDWSAINEPTLEWFLGIVAALARRGLIPAGARMFPEGAGSGAALATWQSDYANFHTAAAMDAAIRKRFLVEGTESSAYLYGYLEEALADHQEEIRPIRAQERELGEKGSLALLGRRWRARVA